MSQWGGSVVGYFIRGKRKAAATSSGLCLCEFVLLWPSTSRSSRQDLQYVSSDHTRKAVLNGG